MEFDYSLKPITMKKIIAEYIYTHGFCPHYAGKTQTMYISRKSIMERTEFEDKLITKFGYGLPFRLVSNDLIHG